MPEHSSWLTFLLAHMRDTLEHNAQALGQSVVGGHEPSWQSFEPIFAAVFIALLLILMALRVRSRLRNVDEAIIPEERLTLRTFMEAFLSYFYDLAKSVMGPERAKKYFPVIGTAALFVFFSNVMALVPGMPVATSSLNITLGSALVVFLLFNIYGLMAQGPGYLKHLAGPVWWLAPLLFPLEVLSLCIRPVTLAIRLMVNMAADHVMLGLFLGMVALFLPIPVMLLGALVVVVQTLVFTLLTCIYIGLATEGHDEHAHAAH
ncbi:MAG TPA: F0F1 ATP synthase subunit A [Polyangiaceae bacterium]|nr:F0F1 ATP synthase subunit A [Polyangiaceae bacterium]